MTECKTGMGAGGKEKPGYVLVADGDASELIYTAMLIQRFEYNSCTTASGTDVLEMAQTAVPALIITVADLPDMPGLDLIRRLRRRAHTASVPVILKRAGMSAAVEQRYRRAGAAAFLDSPVTAEALFRAVQKAIEKTPRSNIRIRTRLPVVIDGRQLDCGQGECVSVLSEYGMYIRTLQPCPPKKRVPVRITVRDRAIELEAQVLYCHHFGEGPFREPGMGLKFTTVTTGDRDYLKAFIQEEIMRGMPPRS